MMSSKLKKEALRIVLAVDDRAGESSVLHPCPSFDEGELEFLNTKIQK